MIGKLKGIIDSIASDKVILDVGGVGYIIYCSGKTLSSIPKVGNQASFLIHMQVKEDDINLFGFLNILEQEWFNHLITVQGIGPKLALNILSYLEPLQLVEAIFSRRKEDFKIISGVGPKLVERIFTELHKKADIHVSNPSSIYIPSNNSSNESLSNINDALLALVNLGYNRNEVHNLCKRIYNENPSISISDLIKAALKQLSS